MSPIKSKTIFFPSGLTSTDIQLPSLVVKLNLRLGFKGNSLKLAKLSAFAVSFFVVSLVKYPTFRVIDLCNAKDCMKKQKPVISDSKMNRLTRRLGSFIVSGFRKRKIRFKKVQGTRHKQGSSAKMKRLNWE